MEVAHGSIVPERPVRARHAVKDNGAFGPAWHGWRIGMPGPPTSINSTWPVAAPLPRLRHALPPWRHALPRPASSATMPAGFRPSRKASSMFRSGRHEAPFGAARQGKSPVTLSMKNAGYVHACRSLWYLVASPGKPQEQSRIIELTINDRAADWGARRPCSRPRRGTRHTGGRTRHSHSNQSVSP